MAFTPDRWGCSPQQHLYPALARSLPMGVAVPLRWNAFGRDVWQSSRGRTQGDRQRTESGSSAASHHFTLFAMAGRVPTNRATKPSPPGSRAPHVQGCWLKPGSVGACRALFCKLLSLCGRRVFHQYRRRSAGMHASRRHHSATPEPGRTGTIPSRTQDPRPKACERLEAERSSSH